ncbi:MAG: hypothetical protein QW434_07575 [Pyrobaculum sp.]
MRRGGRRITGDGKKTRGCGESGLTIGRRFWRKMRKGGESDKRWAEWYETWRKFLGDYFAFKNDVNKRFSRLEENLGALTEAVYTRYVWGTSQLS